VSIIGALSIIALVAGSSRNLFEDGLAWTVMVLAGLALSFFAGLFFQDPRRLVIDERGIWNSEWQMRLLRWSEINHVFIRSSNSGSFVCFRVVDRDALQGMMKPWALRLAQAMCSAGFGDLSVNATRMGLSADEVLELCTKRIADARSI
jgi:hypothetical protein